VCILGPKLFVGEKFLKKTDVILYLFFAVGRLSMADKIWNQEFIPPKSGIS